MAFDTLLPVTSIADPSASNADYPELVPILGPPIPDSVGPEAANQQPTQLGTRTETLRDRLNQLIDVVNAMPAELLQRDGATVGSFMRGDLSMRDAGLGVNNRVINVLAGTAANDAVTKSQLDTLEATITALEALLSEAVLRDGSVAMTGDLNLGANRVINVLDPVLSTDGATRGYVDTVFSDLDGIYVRLDGTNTPMGGVLDMGGFGINGVLDPALGQDAVNLGFMQSAINSLQNAPTGSLAFYAGSVVIPTQVPGWLLCDGQEYSTSLYPTLFAKVGYTYGGGGSLFAVPDLRGRALAGLDDMGGTPASRISGSWAVTLGGIGGSADYVLSLSQMATHNHTYSDRMVGNGVGSYWGPTSGAFLADIDLFPASTDNAGGGLPHNNTQPTMVMNTLIKV